MLVDPVKRLQLYTTLVGLALFIASVGGTVLYIKHLRDSVAELEAANSLLQADLSAANTYRKEHAALTKDKKETDTRVDEVLDRHQDFGLQPVPDDVADLLRQRPDS